MKQYKISLDSQSIAVLDELESALKMPKAKIVKKALLKLKEQFVTAFATPKRHQKKEFIMDRLAGSIHSKGNKKVNYSEQDDDMYFRD